MVREVGSVLVLASFVIAAEWMVAYHRLTGGGWRHSTIGKHVMTFAAVIAMILGMASARVVAVEWLGYHDPLWFRVLRLATYVALPAVLVWRRVLLAKAQREL